MREILFRGKRADNGEWVYGYYIRYGWTRQEKDYIVPSYASDLYAKEVIPETVGQYTGLTDKNGKKIFEGDILKFDDEIWSSYYTSCGTEYDSWKIENYGVVGFDDDYAKYDFVKYKYNENSVEADLHENNTIEFADFVKDLEVIGNAHDNPELLEVKE